MLDLVFAIKDIQKIKEGGKAKLSNRQIVNTIINLVDAKKNVEAENYKKIYELYQYYNMQNDKTEMDLDMLLTRTAFIVSKFDEIVPIELYNGQDSIFLSKTQKEKYIEKAKIIEAINIQKQTLENAKRDLGDNTVEKAQKMYENRIINEEQRDELINAINSLNMIISMTPNSIKMLEDNLRNLDNKNIKDKTFYIDENELNNAINKLNREKVMAIFPGGDEQIRNVGKELQFYLNGKFKMEEMYGLYIRDYFFLLIDMDIYGLYMHMQRNYNNKLSKEEQIKLMAIILSNKSNPNYIFDEKDNLEFFTNYIEETIKTTDENDNEGVMRGAIGKFGIEKTNPIPVFGHNGLDEYFKKLKLENGHQYKYERAGSTSAKNINGIIDVYELYDTDANIQLNDLFICIYNKHTSNMAPEGFIIQGDIDKK